MEERLAGKTHLHQLCSDKLTHAPTSTRDKDCGIGVLANRESVA